MQLLASYRNLVAAVCGALVVFAFVAAPHACAWGLDAYAAAGAAAALALAAAPFVPRWRPRDRSRWFAGLLGVAVLAASWVGGLFAADVRIMCRLF